jgi:predicted AlkP superfamily phosphohydrolase/phosphomutase
MAEDSNSRHTARGSRVLVGHAAAGLALALVVSGDLFLAIVGANHAPVLSQTALGVAVLSLVSLGLPVLLAYGVVVAGLSLWPPLRRRLPDPHVMAVGAILLAWLLGAAATGARGGGAAAAEFLGKHLLLGALAAGGLLAAWLIRWRGARVVLAGLVPAIACAPLVAAGQGLSLRWEAPERAVEPGGAAQSGKVVLIGVDGLCWETLRRWREAGGSPDLEWFERRGLVGPLETIVPTQSPTVWSTISTGRRPDGHGVLSFTAWDVGVAGSSVSRLPRFAGAFAWLPVADSLGLSRMRQVSSADLRAPPVWEILADPERPCTVTGWWCSWPASKINGWMVSDKFYFWRESRRHGSDARAQTGVTYPEDFHEEVDRFRVSPKEMTVEQVQRFADVSDDEARRMLAGDEYRHHSVESELPLAYTMDETYFDMAEHLIETGPERGFYAFYVRGVDLLGHAAMHASELYPEAEATPDERRRYGKLTSRYYAYTFERVRRLVERIGDDAAVIVLSDHGFERVAPDEYGHENAPTGVIMVPNAAEGAGWGAERASVYDIAPTVLWLSGYPAAEDMPGRELVDVFPERARAAPPLPRVPTYGTRWDRAPMELAGDDASNAEQLELLRSLGYIE